MPTKIRLSRHGRKRHAFYHIVVADSRAPRDGKYIERIGSYNPNTNPATIDINFDRALYWAQTGAQPTDTVRSILSNNGVLYLKHLLKGVKKGAFDQAEADAKFEAWKEAKASKVDAIQSKIDASAQVEADTRFEAEKKVNEARAEVIAEGKAALAAEAEAAAKVIADAKAAEKAEKEAKIAAAKAEKEAKEAPVAEVAVEAPVAEATKETPVAEVAKEAPAAKVEKEAPVADAPKEEEKKESAE